LIQILKKILPKRIRFFLRRIVLQGRLFEYNAFVKQFKKKYPGNKAFINEGFEHYLSVVAIVKDEAPYMAEWLEYHLLVGVEKFYIYDNGSTDNLLEILQPYIKEGIVEYISFPGKLMHLPAYNQALRRLQDTSFWIAFIDLDEFIVPVETQTISEFLRDFEQFPGIEINWVLYGSSGHKEKNDGFVIDRFKDHDVWDSPYNRTVKSIHNPRCTFKINSHVGDYIYGDPSVDSDKNKNIIGSGGRVPLHDKLRVNHYFLKSYEEYLVKVNKGRSAVAAKLKIEEFYERDKNDIKNDTIMDKYIPVIKENISKRFPAVGVK
jgi:glycosyltransferase involved in cell wall biosynthesis